ncbi:MAG: hypothetical protein L0I76_22045, partial [Pseudonocardia sp.]|nr:hypothetical protein [Pseudonocardia sp.]
MVNVVTLGVFVVGSALVLGCERLFGAPTRWFGFVSGGIGLPGALPPGLVARAELWHSQPARTGLSRNRG